MVIIALVFLAVSLVTLAWQFGCYVQYEFEKQPVSLKSGTFVYSEY